MPRYSHRPGPIRDAILAIYKPGMSYRECARIVGTGHAVVAKTLRNHAPEKQRGWPTDPLPRFMEKIEKDAATKCWNWQACVSPQGYGTFWWDGKRSTAHRFAYEHFRGPIQAAQDIDHLCRNRLCVNPAHLEAVSRQENVQRGGRWPSCDGWLP